MSDYDYDYEDDDGYDYSGGGAAYVASTAPVTATPDPTSAGKQTAAVPVARGSVTVAVDEDDDWADDNKATAKTSGACGGDRAGQGSNANAKKFVPKRPIIYNKTGLGAIPFVIYYDVKPLCSWIHHTWNEQQAAPERMTSAPSRAGSDAGSRDQRIYARLTKAFQECGNPYWLALYICSYSFDFFQFKLKSLSYEIMRLFKEWLKKTDVEKLKAKHLDKELQMDVLEVTIAQKNTSTAKLMAEVYCLTEIKSEAIERIKDLCSDRYFKEACVIATVLRLYDSFNIHDFIVPLLLQDRENVFEEYLTAAKEKQKPFLLLVDEWLGSTNSYAASLDYAKKHNVDNLHLAKLNVKPLTKLLDRLSSKFDIECSNMKAKQCGNILRHLMFRRYEDANSDMNDAGFEELLDSTVGDNPGLCEEAFLHLKSVGDEEAAARFAIRKSLPLESIPINIQRVMKVLDPNVNFVEPPEIKEDWATGEVRVIQKSSSGAKPATPDPLSSSPVESNIVATKKRCMDGLHEIPAGVNILFCDNAETIDSFLSRVNSLASRGPRKLITGFDAEWKPIMATRKGVAIIQVSLLSEVYLLDVHTLKDKTETHHAQWLQFLKNYFSNEGIIKLGFSIDTDLQNLAKTCAEWADIKHQFKRILDLRGLSNTLRDRCASFFPYLEQSGRKSEINSLGDLVQACFGTKLDKTEQFTDWERRPLRQEQITYAAADTYVLLEIYNFMERRCAELQLDFNGAVTRTLRMPGDSKESGGAKKR